VLYQLGEERAVTSAFHFVAGSFFGANLIWGVLQQDPLNIAVAAMLLASFMWFRHREKRRT
jgi:hypothetical protein